MRSVESDLTGENRYAGRSRAIARSSLLWAKLSVGTAVVVGLSGGLISAVYSEYREDIEQAQEMSCSIERTDLRAYAREHADEVRLELLNNPTGATFFSQEEQDNCGSPLPSIEQGLSLADEDDLKELELSTGSKGLADNPGGPANSPESDSERR